MKHFYNLLLIITFIVFSAGNVFAEEAGKFTENSNVFNQGFGEQKQISDSKFKKTVEQLKERSLTRKQKKIRAQVQPNSPSYDSDNLKIFAESQDPDNELSQTLTVMIPVPAYAEDGTRVQPGYYKLSCHRDENDKYILELSQGTRRIVSVEANQTNQDLGQETIQFCNAEVIPNGRIRLMYGTIDLNLVGYIYYDEK